MLLHRPEIVVAVWCVVSMLGVASAAQTSGFIMVKPGDGGAIPARAEATLARFDGYLTDKVERLAEHSAKPRISNDAGAAAELIRTAKPAVAFVPVGFYLAHLRDPKLHAKIAAYVPRLGKKSEFFHLVAKRDGGPSSLAELEQRKVRTNAIDLPYLQRVVFPAEHRPAEFFELEVSKNLNDDVFFMTEGEDGVTPPDALLLDEELKQFYEKQGVIGPELKVIWTSAPLPRDLVVTLGEWTDDEREQLVEALLGMKKDPEGVKLLKVMRSDGFSVPDAELLTGTTERYDRKTKKDPGSG